MEKTLKDIEVTLGNEILVLEQLDHAIEKLTELRIAFEKNDQEAA